MRAGHWLVAGLVVVSATGCARVKETLRTTPDRVERPATDTPDMFVLESGVQNIGTACLSPIVDPRDKSSLTLVRTRGGQGDYQAPAGKYGLSGNELLRVDCTTGRAVGVVRLQ